MSSDCTPASQFSCGTRIGLSFIAQAACLSCVSVTSLLCYVAYKAFRNRGPIRRRLLKSHLDLYLLGLLISDLIQAIGGIMDIKWIHDAGLTEGTFCTAQGVLEQFGDVGVALCSLAIAVHTWRVVVLRWEEPSSLVLPITLLSLYVVFLSLIVGVGYAVHRHKTYFGATTYWCWIRKEFINEGIGLEYLWLWIAAFVNLILYIPVFLVLKRFIIIETTNTWLGYKPRLATPEERVPTQDQEDARVNARQMLYYPAVYIVTVLPIAVVRIHAFLDSNLPPPPATFFSGVLFSSSGFFNVVVYTSTRPALLRPSVDETDTPTGLGPQVFYLGNTASSDGERKDSGTQGQRGPRLADSAFDVDDVPPSRPEARGDAPHAAVNEQAV